MTRSSAPPTAPLRVGLYTRYYPPDFTGMGLLIQRTLPLLGNYGVEVEVVSVKLGEGDGKGADPAIQRFLARKKSAAHQVHRTWSLRRHFGRAPYDVVHAASAGLEFWLNIGLLQARRIPVLYDMSLLGADDPDSISRLRLGGWRVELLKRAAAWVGLSRGFLPSVRKVGFPEERFHVVSGAVDTEVFRPATPPSKARLRQRLGLPPEARIVISVGSVIPRKGMDRALEAWRGTSPKRGRDLLLIVGPDTQADRLSPADLRHVEQLRALAATPELDGTVRFTGRVDNVEDLMRAADIFLFLSRGEGFGLVIVEAMASGLPCVVSPIDGIAAEMVVEGETGFIVEDADDPRQAAGALDQLLAEPEFLKQQGAAGRQVATERFSMDARARAAASLYRKLAVLRSPKG